MTAVSELLCVIVRVTCALLQQFAARVQLADLNAFAKTAFADCLLAKRKANSFPCLNTVLPKRACKAFSKR